jgi:hypothetical protein
MASSKTGVALEPWVLAPDLLCLSAVERAALTERISHGVSIVSDARVGKFDELGRAAKPLPPAAEFSGRGVFVEPEFKSHRYRSAPWIAATATREDGGAPPRVELGVYADGGSTYVVVVPAWESSADGAGGATASISRTTLTFAFRQVVEPPREVVDLRSGKTIGRVALWFSTSDAAGGLVFELR